jgi:hypothetical protein
LAAGISGNITVVQAGKNSAEATIKANLDFNNVEFDAIKKYDGNCTAEVTEYKWHIHVKWGSKNTSASYKQCSLAETGNHYDPLFACGPNSEYSEDAKCAPKIKNYTCNPGNYSSNFEVCEKGDLSGKFGGIKLTSSKIFVGEWKDSHFPLYSELTPQWNMILHAVCDNKATPRIACAVAQKLDSNASPAPCTMKPSKRPSKKSPAPTSKTRVTSAPTTPSKESVIPVTPLSTGKAPEPAKETPDYPNPTTEAPSSTPVSSGNAPAPTKDLLPSPAASLEKKAC